MLIGAATFRPATLRKYKTTSFDGSASRTGVSVNALSVAMVGGAPSTVCVSASFGAAKRSIHFEPLLPAKANAVIIRTPGNSADVLQVACDPCLSPKETTTVGLSAQPAIITPSAEKVMLALAGESCVVVKVAVKLASALTWLDVGVGVVFTGVTTPGRPEMVSVVKARRNCGLTRSSAGNSRDLG